MSKYNDEIEGFGTLMRSHPALDATMSGGGDLAGKIEAIDGKITGWTEALQSVQAMATELSMKLEKLAPTKHSELLAQLSALEEHTRKLQQKFETMETELAQLKAKSVALTPNPEPNNPPKNDAVESRRTKIRKSLSSRHLRNARIVLARRLLVEALAGREKGSIE